MAQALLFGNGLYGAKGWRSDQVVARATVLAVSQCQPGTVHPGHQKGAVSKKVAKSSHASHEDAQQKASPYAAPAMGECACAPPILIGSEGTNFPRVRKQSQNPCPAPGGGDCNRALNFP